MTAPAQTALRRDALELLATLGESRALRTRAEVRAAGELVAHLGLPAHHDAQKNWDFLKALALLLRHCGPAEKVLDAGSGGGSVIMQWLHMLGYTDLHACDLKSGAPRLPAIRFTTQDITRTDYAAASFGAVACLSVIEHGVPLEAFAREMARILKPGGVLVVSTDFWSEPVDCSGIYPYGKEMGEMKVLGPADIRSLLAAASAAGLEPLGPVDLSTGERAVRWDRVDREYTFLFLALKRR